MRRIMALIVGGLALSTAGSGACRADLMNGGFELPGLGFTEYRTYQTGESFVGWTVEAGNVDVVKSGFGIPPLAAGEGNQWLDLSGNSPGTIAQVVDSDANVAYQLSFLYSGYRDLPPYPGSAGNTVYYQLFDGITDAVIGQGSVLIAEADLFHWTQVTLTATATSSKLGVRFRDDGLGGNNYVGPALDGVSLRPLSVPEPASLGLLAIAGVVAGAYRRSGRRSPWARRMPGRAATTGPRG